jgi:hypothetical protein
VGLFHLAGIYIPRSAPPFDRNGSSEPFSNDSQDDVPRVLG